jgi:hypothetical protein
MSTNLVVGPLAKHIAPRQRPADFDQLLPCERGHLHACTDPRPVLHWSAFSLAMRLPGLRPRFAPRFGMFNPHYSEATCMYMPEFGRLATRVSVRRPDRTALFSHDDREVVVMTKIKTNNTASHGLVARYSGPVPAAMRQRVHALKSPLIVAPVTTWELKPRPLPQPDPYLVEWCNAGNGEHLHVDAWWDLSREELVLEEFITPATAGASALPAPSIEPARLMTEPANTNINSITYTTVLDHVGVLADHHRLHFSSTVGSGLHAKGGK